MLREGEKVYVVYRLKDPDGPDEDQNRVYFTGPQGYAQREDAAKWWAENLNWLEIRKAASGGGTP